jgi:hypothetical protein
MVLMLFKCFPLPAIKEPVYNSCNDACSNIDRRMPAVHCVSECSELKCRRYRFLPAVEMERTFWRGCTSWFRVGSVSIWAGQYYSGKAEDRTHHLDRGIRQINECGRYLAILASRI